MFFGLFFVGEGGLGLCISVGKTSISRYSFTRKPLCCPYSNSRNLDVPPIIKVYAICIFMGTEGKKVGTERKKDRTKKRRKRKEQLK